MNELEFSTLVLSLPDEPATEALGKGIAHVAAELFRQDRMPAGLSLYLEGDLGAGKTTLVRHMLRSLGITGRIKSPTYGLAESYQIDPQLQVWHFDFYRITGAKEWQDTGLQEQWGVPVLRLVEWPGRAGAELPEADMHVTLEMMESVTQARTARLKAASAMGEEWLKRVRSSGLMDTGA
jgi:tRNA threonylcarbamoyladenosine biosynthesis protein TsaE